MAATINYSTPKTSTPSPYSESQNFDFTPTPNPLPQQKEAFNTYSKDYTNFINAQETPTQIADRYSNKYNVPFLQEQQQKNSLILGDTANRIQALPASVAGASGNSMLTQGQKDRIVQSQAAPLTQNYNNLSQNANGVNQALGQAQDNVNKAITYEQADQMKKIQPWLQKYDAMTVFNAAEQTAWNATNSWELDRLIHNQAAGVQLSEGEQGRLYNLAAQEASFQSALDNIHATGDETRKTQSSANEMYLEGWGM